MTEDRTVARHVRDVDWTRDDTEILGAGGQLPALVEDMLDIASSALVADRCVHRGAADSTAWSRQMHVEVAVNEPGAWRSHPLATALADVLTWLTEDEWCFTFTRRPDRSRWVAPQLPVDVGEHDVALFSGGLDSVAGAAGRLASGASLRGISVWTNPRMRGYQSRCAHELLLQHGARFEHCSVRLSRIGRHPAEEATRRSRPLGFLAVGWAAALVAGRQELFVMENGVGAINLPFNRSQHGCMTSRAMHPRTLALVAELFSLLGDAPFTIINPHLGETKARMCARLPASARGLVGASRSCDLAAASRNGSERCESCSSCLLRSIALAAADRSDWDVAPPAPRGSRVDCLPAMLGQAAALDRALASAEPWSAMLTTFPALADLPHHGLSPSGVIDLYREHVAEVRSYPHPLVPRFLAEPRLAA